MTAFEPGDRVRFRARGDLLSRTGDRWAHGTALFTEPWYGQGVTRVDFDTPFLPRGLYVRSADLELAGCRVLPFDLLATGDMRQHLRVAHGSDFIVYGPDERPIMIRFHALLHIDTDGRQPVVLHTHGKARR